MMEDRSLLPVAATRFQDGTLKAKIAYWYEVDGLSLQAIRALGQGTGYSSSFINKVVYEMRSHGFLPPVRARRPLRMTIEDSIKTALLAAERGITAEEFASDLYARALQIVDAVMDDA